MTLRILITVAAAAALIAHFVWPDLEADATTIALVALALFPWLKSIIRSIELPGGVKIELAEAKAVTKKITQSPRKIDLEGKIEAKTPTLNANLQVVSRSEAIADRIRFITAGDPNLALVAVGIEIEKKLRELAAQNNIDTQRASLGILLNKLEDADALPTDVTSGLRDIIGLRNQAAHGAEVSVEAAEWVLDTFPSVLAVLDGIPEGDALNQKD